MVTQKTQRNKTTRPVLVRVCVRVDRGVRTALADAVSSPCSSPTCVSAKVSQGAAPFLRDDLWEWALPRSELVDPTAGWVGAACLAGACMDSLAFSSSSAATAPRGTFSGEKRTPYGRTPGATQSVSQSVGECAP